MKFYTVSWLALLAWAQPGEVGSRACAGCHADIYARYQATGMARSAGRGGSSNSPESFAQASFTHAASGASYQVTDNYELTFSGLETTGRRILSWYLGSGKVGRSYLFSSGDGWLFQAPVSYYAEAQKWDLSPGYQRKLSIELTRGVETACLAVSHQPPAGPRSQPLCRPAIPRRRCQLRALPWPGADARSPHERQAKDRPPGNSESR